MNSKSSMKITRIVLALFIGMVTFQGAAYAQIGSDPGTNARNSRIVGLWNVQVTGHDCDTGAPLNTFSALHKYELGGTGQVVPAGNPGALSAHMMVWNWLQGNDYQIALKFFRFNIATNTVTGFTVIRGIVSINDEGTEYTGSVRAEGFLLDGTPSGGTPVCPTFAGTRFQ